ANCRGAWRQPYPREPEGSPRMRGAPAPAVTRIPVLRRRRIPRCQRKLSIRPRKPAPGLSFDSFLQFFRRAQDQGRLGVEDSANHHQRGVRLIPLLLFDRLAGGGKGFDTVAGIEPRRIDLVCEPRAAGEAIGTGELAFTFNERLVHPLE